MRLVLTKLVMIASYALVIGGIVMGGGSGCMGSIMGVQVLVMAVDMDLHWARQHRRSSAKWA